LSVIVLTAFGSMEAANAAIGARAYDFATRLADSWQGTSLKATNVPSITML
jgi:hypothetical protein